jgi:threonine/homoserine/homoserine lactone efflux protein
MSMLTTLAAVGPMWLVAVAIPGPNFLTVSRLAVLRGRPAAMASVGGIALGTACWGLAGLFGVQALFVAAPMLYGALQLFGAAWLIVVGVRAISGSFQPTRPRPQASGTAWWMGLATSLSNPKSALLVGSLFTALLAPGTPIATGLAAVAEMILISFTWYAGLSLLISTPAIAAGFGRAERWIDRLAGGIFIAFGLHIVISRA